MPQDEHAMYRHASGSEANTVALWKRLLTAVLVFVYFELGYTWAAKGHFAEELFFAHTPVDDWIPLIPVFIVFYMLGYLFVFAPVVMFEQTKDYYWGVCLSIVILSTAFLIFKNFPVYMHKPYATGTDAFSRLTYLTQAGDFQVNNFPSLHVALNVYCWLLLFLRYGRRMLWLIWAPILIVASTVLVKQHLVLDVIGGLALGGVAGLVFWRLHAREGLGRIGYWLALSLTGVVILTNAHRLPRVAAVVGQSVAEIFERGWLVGAAIIALLLLCAWMLRKTQAKGEA
ncbi:MAG: phosphatase PAP2 family protein [Nevskiales bacterium]